MKETHFKINLKTLIPVLLLWFSGFLISAQALGYDYHNAVNYPPKYFEKSDFSHSNQSYDLADIRKQLDRFISELNELDLSIEQERELNKLYSMINPTPTTPKYQIAHSTGPRWKNRVTEVIENFTDINENISYITESWDEVIEYCNYKEVEPNWDAPSKDTVFINGTEYFFTWESIKVANGGKSVAYIATLRVPSRGPDKISGQLKKCDFPRSRWTVLNKDIHPLQFVDSKYYQQ